MLRGRGGEGWSGGEVEWWMADEWGGRPTVDIIDLISGTSAALFAQMAASTQPVLIELTVSPDLSTPETESGESPDEPTRDPETYGAAHVSTTLVIVGIACGVIAPIAVPRSAIALELTLLPRSAVALELTLLPRSS